MKRYLLNVIQPSHTPPPANLDQIMEEVQGWNGRLKDAGAWVFTGRLHGPDASTVVHPGGGDLVTDGPFAEGKEHIGGFTIIEVADLDAALEWTAEFTRITRLPVEVRPFLDAGDG